jgi:hypothetical protein
MQTSSAYLKDFEQFLWPIMLDTMRGEISYRSYSKEPFNRCKLLIRARSHALASDIYDREAMTRMMTGFYRGLALGSAVSILALSVSALGLFCSIASAFHWFNWNVLSRLDEFGYCTLLFSVLWVLNRWLLVRVTKNFHILRMSEAQAVYDAYIFAHTIKSQQFDPSPQDNSG